MSSLFMFHARALLLLFFFMSVCHKAELPARRPFPDCATHARPLHPAALAYVPPGVPWVYISSSSSLNFQLPGYWHCITHEHHTNNARASQNSPVRASLGLQADWPVFLKLNYQEPRVVPLQTLGIRGAQLPYEPHQTRTNHKCAGRGKRAPFALFALFSCPRRKLIQSAECPVAVVSSLSFVRELRVEWCRVRVLSPLLSFDWPGQCSSALLCAPPSLLPGPPHARQGALLLHQGPEDDAQAPLLPRSEAHGGAAVGRAKVADHHHVPFGPGHLRLQESGGETLMKELPRVPVGSDKSFKCGEGEVQRTMMPAWS
jgi:hypothetical protein